MRPENLDKLVLLRQSALDGVRRYVLAAMHTAPLLSKEQVLNLVGDTYQTGREDVAAAAVETFSDFKTVLKGIVGAAKRQSPTPEEFMGIMSRATTLDINSIADIASSVYEVSDEEVESIVQKSALSRRAALKQWSWDILDPSWEVVEVEGCKHLKRKDRKED